MMHGKSNIKLTTLLYRIYSETAQHEIKVNFEYINTVSTT